jgi:hypothetical protein
MIFRVCMYSLCIKFTENTRNIFKYIVYTRQQRARVAYTRWGVGWGSDNSDYSGVTLYVRVCMTLCVCVCTCEGQRRKARTGRRTRDGQGTTWQGQRGQGKTGKAWTRQARTASGHVSETARTSRRHKGQSIGL